METRANANTLRIHSLPCWQGPLDIEPLKGGLSNESYLVSDRAGKHVVRFGQDFPFHHVSREREVMTARAAHAGGFAPRLEFAQPGVMVSAFVEARTYTAQDVRNERHRIAKFIRRFHLEMPRYVSGSGFMFWVFHVIRDYARTLNAGKHRLSLELPFYLELADELEEAQIPLVVVIGHNDLLPGNFLDDGDRLWLIDFEYAGFNTAMFDLANVASNADFDARATRELLAVYYGREPEPVMLRAHSAMQCASLLREAMWSMVSELHLETPGVDYVAYAEENLARLRIALEDYRTVYGKTPT